MNQSHSNAFTMRHGDCTLQTPTSSLVTVVSSGVTMVKMTFSTFWVVTVIFPTGDESSWSLKTTFTTTSSPGLPVVVSEVPLNGEEEGDGSPFTDTSTRSGRSFELASSSIGTGQPTEKIIFISSFFLIPSGNTSFQRQISSLYVSNALLSVSKCTRVVFFYKENFGMTEPHSIRYTYKFQ